MIRASADPITRGEKKRALLQERERGTMFAAWQGRQAGGGKKERTTGREPSSEQMCRENQAASVGGSAKAPRPSYPVQLQFCCCVGDTQSPRPGSSILAPAYGRPFAGPDSSRPVSTFNMTDHIIKFSLQLLTSVGGMQ